MTNETNISSLKSTNEDDQSARLVGLSARPRYAHELTPADHVAALVELCHGASLKAGWWNDPKTGEPLQNNPLMFGNKILMTHTELSEAVEGDRRNRMDDKLPHRPMREVEVADALIRLFDLAGAFGLDVGGALTEKMDYNAQREDHKVENRAKADGKAY